MAPRTPTKDEIQAAKEIMDAFPGAEFITVYEGVGETWDFNKAPVFTGLYQRKESVEMLKYGSKTEMENRTVYTFTGADGTLYALWDSFSLRRGLSDAKAGELYRITYNGKEPIGNSDREVKD